MESNPYRVLNGCSPLWVKLNLPATGHLTDTGFLAIIFNEFLISLDKCN